MSGDAATFAFYTHEAEAYAARARSSASTALDAFLAALPPDAAILELGCGDGRDAEVMLARGFAVTPTDGTPAMARQAEARLGRPVAVLPFNRIDAEAAYDGVWANACLLHVPRPDLPGVLARIHRALRSGGLFAANYKSGEVEGRDRFGRLYNFPDQAWLETTYRGAGAWTALDMSVRPGGGYDGVALDWIEVLARR